MKTASPASHVPKLLAERPHWVVWKVIRRKGKPTKFPFNPRNLGLCSTTEPRSWGTLDQARTALETREFAGLGFCFLKGDDLFGVDLDSCMTGLYTLDYAADHMVRLFSTYTEVSPSGTGIKLFGVGRYDGVGLVKTFDEESTTVKRKALELYGWGRFFAFTGRHWEDTPLELRNCQAELDGLVKAMVPAPRPRSAPSTSTRAAPTDVPLIERGRRYLAKVPPAVAGQGGHGRTFRAACVLIREIGLNPGLAYQLLNEWNDRCDPPWSEKELWHKVNSAAKVK